MDIEKSKYFNDKYEAFLQILLEFLEGGYLEEDNEVTIKRFCEERNNNVIQDIIQEGQELLELDPFPWEWMVDMGQLLCAQVDQYVGNINLSEEEIKKGARIKIWTKCVIEAIEAEGKRVGKL